MSDRSIPSLVLRGVFAAGLALAAAAPTAALAQAQEQYFGIPSSRVGPYSAMGTGYYGGIIDYLNYVNLKFGGVNGRPLSRYGVRVDSHRFVSPSMRERMCRASGVALFHATRYSARRAASSSPVCRHNRSASVIGSNPSMASLSCGLAGPSSGRWGVGT